MAAPAPNPALVNAWMARKTQGLITSILDPQTVLDPQAILLANSVFFRASWSFPFNPLYTSTAPFNRTDGSQAACAMMAQAATLPYGENAQYQARLLPYGKGRFAMLLVLPKPGAAWQDLDPVLQGVPAGLAPREVILRMPRFETGFSDGLDTPLKAMGMARAFDPDRADFSMLSAIHRHIGSVVHAARMVVDERGTLAAAGTVVSVSGTSLPETEMTLDRPFLYAILDQGTGGMVFLGQMGDPRRK